MFKIIKKGSGNFWHNFNNGSKEVNLSDWEIVLDSVNQTVSLQMLNGANVPINSVFISDILIIDETDGSVEETFVSVEALRIRLVELNYTPYIVLNGFVPEAPIDGLTYGRKDSEWVEVSGGGSVGTLQQVTDNGNTTTNDITAGGFLSLGNANIPGINFNDAEDLDTSLGFLGADPSITTPRNWVLPDTSGTIALNSDIPTVDATPTDGSSNAVSSNGVFDELALKQDFATATTGAVISFAVPQVYNSVASPTSSNITNDLTGARIGVVQKIFHNSGSAPTFPAGWVKLGTGSYVNSTLNIIYCEWVSGSRVEYWITQ
jgi:hypothetical protein